MPQEPGFATLTVSVDGVDPVTVRASVSPVSSGDVVFRFLDAGGYHACGITTTEQLLCWGYGADGQLGLGSTTPRLSPTLIPGDFRYRRVTGGYYHSCAFTLATMVWCWGNNAEGRLGNGSTGGQSDDPTKVTTFASLDTVAGDTIVGNGQMQLSVQTLQAGWAHTCGIDPAQRLYCWGRGFEGQNGDSTFSNTLIAFQVDAPALYKWVTVGGLHSCGITTGGEGRCWGYNVSGQLGDGTNNTTGLPQPVAGGLSFGWTHS